MDLPLDALSVPFRMRPGLRRLEPSVRILTPLAGQSALAAQKRAVVQAGASRFCAPGTDPYRPVEAIAAQAKQEGLTAPDDAWDTPELLYEEDFALIDTQTGRLEWMAICCPSHWAPEDKLGMHFTEIHAPVADNESLLAATRGLMALIGRGACWERHVWTISPSPRHDQHPARHRRVDWPTDLSPEELVQSSYLRAERQCFFPVRPDARWAIFSIRVMLEPLATRAQQPGWAERITASLASMTSSVLAYKGLGPVRDHLLTGLRRYL